MSHSFCRLCLRLSTPCHFSAQQQASEVEFFENLFCTVLLDTCSNILSSCPCKSEMFGTLWGVGKGCQNIDQSGSGGNCTKTSDRSCCWLHQYQAGKLRPAFRYTCKKIILKGLFLLRAELTNDQSGALSTYYECTLRVVNISFSGKDAVISRSGKDNNRPTLEEYLSQLIPCLPRVSMCRFTSRCDHNP